MASEKALSILEEIKSLTILEMNDLVKALEEEFGCLLYTSSISKQAQFSVPAAFLGLLTTGTSRWGRPL